MEETRLQELRKARELVVQKEENQYLKNLVAEQEKTISSLEQDIVQQNMVRRNNFSVSHYVLLKNPQFQLPWLVLEINK